MWKPIYQPEPWPKFVKRKDIIGLPLMEQRRKFMEEQILFENYVSSVNTVNTVSTAAAGAAGGPAPSTGGGGPVPNPNFPLDNTSIVTAVALYFSDQAAAEAQYGLLNEWNTTGVTNMNRLFSTYSKPQAEGFNEDISGWDVSNVTDMTYMFYQQFDFNQPLGAWDVSSVTSVNSMFYNATSFNQDLSGWDLSSANNLSSIFYGATAFNNGGQALTWTMPSGGGFKQLILMFQNANSFNQDCSSWVVEGNINQIFYLASSFNNGGQPLTWDVSNVTSMNGLFQGTSFNQDISTWDVSNVTNMGNMFQSNTSFNQDLGSWDMSNVSSPAYMFLGATSFNNGGSDSINNWDMTGVPNGAAAGLASMFQNATSFNQPLGNWDVTEVKNFSDMFNGATSFNQDLSSWTPTKMTGLYFGTMMGFNRGFLNTAMSTANYDALLIAWSALTFTDVNIPFGMNQTTQYSAGAAATARGVLTGAPNNWTITDGGQA